MTPAYRHQARHLRGVQGLHNRRNPPSTTVTRSWLQTIRTSQVKSGQVKSGQVRTGQIWTGQVWSMKYFLKVQVRIGQVCTGQISRVQKRVNVP